MMVTIKDSDMDSALLKVFVEVSTEGSFSAAAKKLNYVQSNVTARVKQLEESLGHRLFHRKSRGVVLTKAGETLIPHAKEIVRKIDEADNVMKALGETAGRLRIGSTECNAAIRLAPMLSKLHNRYPKVEFHLFTSPTEILINELLEYRLDVAFVSGIPESDELMVLKEIEEPMALIEASEGGAEDVMIVFKRGCTYNESLRNIMPALGQPTYSSMEFGSLETIVGCVSAGMGRSFLPENVVNKYAGNGKVRFIELPEEYRNIPTCLVCRRDAQPAIDMSIFDI